jgi:hypothetical protein
MEKNEVIWIQSTKMPKDNVSYNEWCNNLSVSSKIPLGSNRGLKHSLNDEYDFSKLFKKKSTKAFNFSWILKYFKFSI